MFRISNQYINTVQWRIQDFDEWGVPGVSFGSANAVDFDFTAV